MYFNKNTSEIFTEFSSGMEGLTAEQVQKNRDQFG